MSEVRVCIVWAEAPPRGAIAVAHGSLARLAAAGGSADPGTGTFAFPTRSAGRLDLAVANARVGFGAFATRVTVRAESNAFTFFLRDVNRQTPLLVAGYGVAVTDADDLRTYRRIESDVRARRLSSDFARIEAEPEETLESAGRVNRRQVAPTWLGISRDIRLFNVHYQTDRGYWGVIEPRYHRVPQALPESAGKPIQVLLEIGRGSACQVNLTRRLEEGVLPILHSVQTDGDVRYRLTFFVTLETGPLGPGRLRGTHCLAAYANSGGQMMTPEEKTRFDGDLKRREMLEREEETVLWVRVQAENQAGVPRYAFFKGLHIGGVPTTYDAARGHCLLASGRVMGLQFLDGTPMPQEETAILLQPGATVTADFLVPHQPLSVERAARLAGQTSEEHLAGCRRFWQAKLASAAQLSLPEREIENRVKAGLLHLDLVAYGLEPDQPVAATIGVYSPIGSEFSPIIQFFDSVGWHDLAGRSLEFFLDRQREDGFIQTFGGYQLETGAVLWTLGEHYRYTGDDAWVRRVRPKVLKACEYLIAWRSRNKREDLRGLGYGLAEGKVADPEDFYHSFMLNALSCVGLSRSAEMLAAVDPESSRRLAVEAADYRRDLRTAYLESVANSPVIPLGDGTWVPSFAPWAEHPGPVSLYAEGGTWQTHGAFVARDSLIGPLYLILCEVLDPREPAAQFLLRAHQELCLLRNAGFSQPYYVRHDYAHLRRGEVKAFLKTYYNQVTALQDRETYTFWEHYFGASPHKTHEEGWFLMQTRWMLYLEEGETLRLLPGIPRRWLKDGETIVLAGWKTHFGPLSLAVRSRLSEGRIEAEAACGTDGRPRTVLFRLRHPGGRRAMGVTGGEYDPDTETVRVEPFGGRAAVVLRF